MDSEGKTRGVEKTFLIQHLFVLRTEGGKLVVRMFFLTKSRSGGGRDDRSEFLDDGVLEIVFPNLLVEQIL